MEREGAIRSAVLWLATIGLLLGAGSVKTRDGRTIEGEIRLGEGVVAVQPRAGGAVVIRQADVDRVAMREPDYEPRGLKGQYFGDTKLTALRLVRTDPEVCFDWPAGVAPAASLPASDYSVRWTGTICPRYSEEYTIALTADDGVRLWIDGRKLIDDWRETQAFTRKARVNLRAGRRHAIRIEYYNGSSLGQVQLAWSSASQKEEVVPAGCLFPAAPAFEDEAMGAKAEYYSGENFEELKLTRLDPRIDFNWGYGAPDMAVGQDMFSVRWTARFQPRFSERYTFAVESDDGVRVWIDGRLLIDHWKSPTSPDARATMDLVAGRTYTLRMEHREGNGEAKARLYWWSASQPKEPVGPLAPPLPSTSTRPVALAGEPRIDWSMPVARKGLVLRDGSIVAGEVRMDEEGRLALTPADGKPLIVARRMAAGVFYRRETQPAAAAVADRPGAVLANGDFVSGELRRLSADQAEISSVLFGVRRYTPRTEVHTIILQRIVAPSGAIRVTANDGSVYMSRSIRIEPGQVVVTHPELGTIRVTQERLHEIAVVPAGEGLKEPRR